jgi:poly(A) polymerase
MPMHIPQWLRRVSRLFHSEGSPLYLVGGAVRDQLLGRQVGEWDAASAAAPDRTETLLKRAGAKDINTIGKRFGTVAGNFEGEALEITTFRGEHYQPDSRHPVTKFGKTLNEDLSRRDFTVNAVAYGLTEDKLHDPFGGQADLHAKIIRAVGDPRARFHEDPLRMLRAVRFAVQLGFTIEAETAAAISQEKERFGILSAERVRDEVSKILLCPEPSRGIQLIVETGLIQYILPELLPSIDLEFDPREHKDIYGHILQVLDKTPPRIELRWCALLHDIAKPLTRRKINGEYHFLGHENLGAKQAREVLTRLKYPSDFIKYVAKLARLHQRIPGYDGSWTDGGVRRFVRDAGEALEDLFIFAEADSTGKNEHKLALYRHRRQELKERIKNLGQEAEIAKIKSPLDGAELMQLFKRPAGPWIKPIKEHLLGLVLDGKLAPQDKKGATKVAKELMRGENHN